MPTEQHKPRLWRGFNAQYWKVICKCGWSTEVPDKADAEMLKELHRRNTFQIKEDTDATRR